MLNRQFNVLIIEDELDMLEHIEGVFLGLGNNVSTTKVSCRDDAIALLTEKSSFFDYITLDLTMPSIQGSFEKNAENGLAVLATITQVSSGTPVLILTGTSTIDMIQEFLQSSHIIDIWGSGVYRATIEHLTKSKIGDLNEKLSKVYNEFSSIINIELILDNMALPIEHDRLIRVFINQFKGCQGEVKVIGGGLSSAKVYGLNILDLTGNLIHRAICKCGPKIDINEDAENYKTFINRLKPEATPRLLGHQIFSAKSNCGVCYGLAQNYNDSFFQVTPENFNVNLKKSIVEMLSPWHNSRRQEQKSIKEIRQMLVDDDVAHVIWKKYNLEEVAVGFESQNVFCKISCIHKDFHGENILLDVNTDKATLIDYGDVSEGISILDPLTLECSFLFHPSSEKYENWPTDYNLDNWTNLELYLSGCPADIIDKVRFCRDWISELGIRNRELAACLYSYALRQLKYTGTDHDIALKLINVSFSLYEKS